ncbi:hypothetical protein EDD29_4417 [Actinocorallia herbida]|uniref:Secreted protein n=1 Tax=Actinocorallia herbida TaxID=58109 RepID=A0A3N1CZY2_9ACTN|nr:hypothetical protein [Actinocorallia herbida]ROO86835.1 hypothetical protein EDD29_4417 [Actinocorallia herbida]
MRSRSVILLVSVPALCAGLLGGTAVPAAAATGALGLAGSRDEREVVDPEAGCHPMPMNYVRLVVNHTDKDITFYPEPDCRDRPVPQAFTVQADYLHRSGGFAQSYRVPE